MSRYHTSSGTASVASSSAPSSVSSSVASALDHKVARKLKFGENGHCEHTAKVEVSGEDYAEVVQQLFFNLTRAGNKTTFENIINQTKQTLHYFYKDTNCGNWSMEKMQNFVLFYKMIGHTRDIINGKGEYNLSYMLVYEWSKYDMELAKQAFTSFVKLEDDEHPYGSWKDVKYFCNYVRNAYGNDNHELIEHACTLIIDRLRIDNDIFVNSRWSTRAAEATSDKKYSLAARWIPREKSKQFGWLFKKLAVMWSPHIIDTSQGSCAKSNMVKQDIKHRGRMKCFTMLRHVCSNINRELDTTQIKQCNNKYADIDMNTVTSITMRNQRLAFMNKTKAGKTRSTDEDRVVCSQHFTQHVEDAKNGKVEMKGKRVGMREFVSDALNARSDVEEDAINAQWKSNSSLTGALPKMIAMVDTSGSMSCDNSLPLHTAVGLGIRVAEKSALGKRVMTFSSSPSWINLDNHATFTNMVKRIAGDNNWGMSTNFSAALNLILDAIVEAKLSPNEVEGMMLTIFSDMQIDQHGNEPINETMFKLIERRYAEEGFKLWGTPFKPPFILFWNLRATDGFPSLSMQKNTAMMSGTSPALLNEFCDKGLDGLKNATPWNFMRDALNHKRYNCLGTYCKKYFTNFW